MVKLDNSVENPKVEIKKLKRTSFMIKFMRALIGFGYLIILIASFDDNAKATVLGVIPLLIASAGLPMAHKFSRGHVSFLTLAASFSSYFTFWVVGTEIARILPSTQPLWMEALGFGSLVAGIICAVLGLLNSVMHLFDRN